MIFWHDGGFDVGDVGVGVIAVFVVASVIFPVVARFVDVCNNPQIFVCFFVVGVEYVGSEGVEYVVEEEEGGDLDLVSLFGKGVEQELSNND